MTTITYGTADFLAVMGGRTITANTPPFVVAELQPRLTTDDHEFSRFAALAGALFQVPRTEVVSTADVAERYWRADVMPNAMQRLA